VAARRDRVGSWVHATGVARAPARAFGAHGAGYVRPALVRDDAVPRGAAARVAGFVAALS
jgi:aspartate/methionine/tyrosine aminotransferase